ncbi:hypothetical protein BJV77DRAFT_965908 [Russula vinacea]|nr:hypothetical protein BJV77DRAFT_965908 [Russula vinacea]
MRRPPPWLGFPIRVCFVCTWPVLAALVISLAFPYNLGGALQTLKQLVDNLAIILQRVAAPAIDTRLALDGGVISGDSFVLRGRPGPQGRSPKERILYLADVSAPKLGNASREDEPSAYEARDFLRALTVGKEIAFTSSHQLPPGEETYPVTLVTARSTVLTSPTKLKDLKREATDDDLRRKDLESEAKSASRGQWNPHGPKARRVIHNMSLGPQGFINEWKGKQLDTIVESVRNGTTLRGRAVHVRRQTSEPFGDDPCFPVLHPVGNIVQFLLGGGLAHFVEWHSGMLAPYGGSEKLRAADRAAKEKRLGLHANAPSAIALSKSISGISNGAVRAFDGSVIRIWSGDQISVVTKNGKERRIQLSSTRGPNLKQAYYAQEAREFLRKKLIGKYVRVKVDFVWPREGEYEERESATVRVGSQNVNVVEQLIEKGLASVLRHQRDDEDRSPNYDKLMAAEQAFVQHFSAAGTWPYQLSSSPPPFPLKIARTASHIFGGRSRPTVRELSQPDTVAIKPWLSLKLYIQPDSVHTIQDALTLVSQPQPVQVGPSDSGNASQEVLEGCFSRCCQRIIWEHRPAFCLSVTSMNLHLVFVVEHFL